MCVCVCHVASDSRGASGYDSRQGSRSSAHHGKVLDVSGCSVLDIAALSCVFVHLAFCWSWRTHRQCARSLSVRFAQHRQGKTYVWRQPHACMPQKATLWGALGYFKGSDKVHLYLTVILPLRHPHAACALQRLTFQSMPDSLVFWSIHPSS